MQVAMITSFIAGCLAGLGVALLAARGRHEELRKALDEARNRETAADARAENSESRREETERELRAAVEEKGKFQNEATRVDEVKSALAERGAQIDLLNRRIAELEREGSKALAEADSANRRADDMVANERETQQAVIKAKDEQIAKLNEFIDTARGVLTNEFKALSADALKDAREQLSRTTDGLIEKHGAATIADVELRRTQIEKMLGPVEETIKRLDKQVEESDEARTKAETLLNDQINRLAGASESLSNALSKPVVRGNWGDMTLENALEKADLRADIDFTLQHTTDAEDGRKRTDAIINLPSGRKLIIDSKNLMESYLALTKAENEAEKAILAETHAKSLRWHIKDLSSKKYWERYEGLDCVILFIPHDGMYHAAIQDEAELIREAYEKRVFITNPISLIPLLKAICYVLNQERANKSAEAIRKVGAELYGQVVRFAQNMANIGSRLQSTVKAYNDAIPGLDRYIVSGARNLKQLGAGRGADAELPEPIELEPRLFSSKELKTSNLFLQQEEDAGLEMAAVADNSEAG
jgi:DNA recombination protein RmuC